MAQRKIIWTRKANLERKEILYYWINRNKSKTYSTKLNRLFIDSVKQLSEHPNIGRKTNAKNIRVIILKDYLLFYESNKDEIIVLSVWDSRREENTV